MNLYARWIGLLVLLWSGACGPSAGNGASSGNGAVVAALPLQLEPAPAGLCGGEGSDKECGPEGCVEAPVAPGASTLPVSASPIGVAAPSTPSLPGGSSQSPPSQPPPPPSPPQSQVSFGGAGGAGGTGSAGMSAGTGGAEACGHLPDGGVLADGGLSQQCMEASVGVTPSALIEPDVPGCAQIDPSKPSTLYLSADDSNSMAGPVIARRVIESGGAVPAHVIRPWEFLNYYDFGFEPAAPGEVRIVPQLSSCPEHDRLSLQIALQAEARDPIERPALNLTFVVDTSGSMGSSSLGGALPIELARAAVTALAGRLRAGDIVSVLTWNTDQLELLGGHVVSGPFDASLLAAAGKLAPLGGTDLHSGLVRGYELAERHYTPERINRVILISDGVANAGVTDEALIAAHADDEEGDDGIYLAGIGVGDGFNDTLMNAVTDAGRGAYVYLDSLAEAERMLGERYLQVVDLAARSVRLEVTLPHHLVLEKFYGEVASTDASKVRPQHLGPNDAMLFFQVLRACDPSLLRGDDRILLLATWETPFTRTPREAVIDTTLNALAGDDQELDKAAAVAGYAEALLAAATATEPGAGRAALAGALADVQAAKNAETDPDLREIARLLERYMARFGL